MISDDNSSGVEEETLTEGWEAKSIKSRFSLPRTLVGPGQELVKLRRARILKKSVKSTVVQNYTSRAWARCFKAPSVNIEVTNLKYELRTLLS